MKKLLVIVSCVVAILAVSNLSFAQEGLVDPEVATPCPCSAAPGVPAPAPFAYPAYPPVPARFFGAKRAAKAAALVAPVAVPNAVPYPYSVADLKPRAVRRAARLAAAAAQPYPMPMPVPAPVAPMMAGDSSITVNPIDAPDAPSQFSAGKSSSSYGPVEQAGKRNISLQRSGTTGPVINFLSIVRAPNNPYVGYPAPMPVQ